MSPHALPPSPTESSEMRGSGMTDTLCNNDIHADHTPGSHLQRHSDDEIQDLVCVGFGPASLAIAVALHDAIDAGDPVFGVSNPKVRFLERQHRFAWHAGMLLPGAKMQITFIKDLATLRNPRSEFTFMNYLHQKDRLVSFANLGTFLPQRIEYEDYMRWCADRFDDVVDYNKDVQSVNVGATDPNTGTVDYFRVVSTDRATGHQSVQHARHVVIAAGGRPKMPPGMPSNNSRIIHSSQYATNVGKIFPPGQSPRSVAVIGAGQSAAEVFHNIHSRFPGAKSTLIIRGAALRPSDDSPFVNEIFDPERVNDVYHQQPAVRAEAIKKDKATNYGVVRIELLEDIYTTMYTQRVQYASEEAWPQRILNHRTVTGVEDISSSSKSPIRLHIRNECGTFQAGKQSCEETLDVDLVVVASGYTRNAHEEMLSDMSHLMPESTESDEKRWQVRRDYGVQFQEGSVSSNAGVWLQGCNESTHGLSDSLLSILANRGGEMVQNIFGGAGEQTARKAGINGTLASSYA